MKNIITLLLLLMVSLMEAQITTYPWVENFDDLTAVSNQMDYPEGWTVWNNNNDSAYWDVLVNSDLSTNNAFSAPNSMHMSFDVENDADDWLITPELSLEATAVYQLNFRYRTFDNGQQIPTNENMEVFLLIDDDPLQIAQSLVSLPGINNQEWLEESIQFTSPASDDWKIAFLCHSAPFQFLLAIDDVQVSVIAASVESFASKTIKSYPNPSTGLITIDGLHEQAAVQVINMQGQQVMETMVHNGKIDITTLPVGSYVLRALKEEDVLLSRCLIER